MFIKCLSDPTYILLMTVVHCKIFSWLCLPQESHGARIRTLQRWPPCYVFLGFTKHQQAPSEGRLQRRMDFFWVVSLSLRLRVGWINSRDLPKVHGFLVAYSANTRTCTLKRWNGKLLALSFESLIFVTIDFLNNDNESWIPCNNQTWLCLHFIRDHTHS